MFYAVTCTILRLPCMTDANFNVIEDGKRLKGNVISKHYGATNVQCTIFCVQNLKCRSYNINQAKLVCELNSKALADNGTVLVDDKEWQYKSTNYSNLLVCSGFLQILNTCLLLQLEVLKLKSSLICYSFHDILELFRHYFKQYSFITLFYLHR